jgi:argininosuccinate synthase
VTSKKSFWLIRAVWTHPLSSHGLRRIITTAKSSPFSGDVGRAPSWTAWRRRPENGGSKLYIEDLTDEFVENFVIPTMMAGAKFEGYLLGTSFARPVIAKRVVEIALKEGADAFATAVPGRATTRCALS